MQISLRKANTIQNEIANYIVGGFDTIDRTVDAILVDDWQGVTARLEQEHTEQIAERRELIGVRWTIRNLIAEANHHAGINKLMGHIASDDYEVSMLENALHHCDVQQDAAIYERKIELKRKDMEKTERSPYQRDNVEIPVFTKPYRKNIEREIATLKKQINRYKDLLLEKNITTKVTLTESMVDLLVKYNLIDA